jgi:hypothetical protein
MPKLPAAERKRRQAGSVRRWRARQKAAGLCRLCTARIKPGHSTLCIEHARQLNEAGKRYKLRVFGPPRKRPRKSPEELIRHHSERTREWEERSRAAGKVHSVQAPPRPRLAELLPDP